MSVRVLVTGGTGFIGRHAVKDLVARGCEVVVLASREPQAPVPGAQYVQCDLTRPEDMRVVVASIGADTLLHLAWRAVVGGLWIAPDNMDWLHIGLQLSQAFVDAGGKRVVVGGSCGEYDWTNGLCREGVTPLMPSTYYGACKTALFHALRGYCDANLVEFAWGRVFFVYGPGEHESRLAASVVTSILRVEEALCSHGLQLRDYMHVEDVGRGLSALAASSLVGDYNIATGQAVRVRDVICGLAEALGRSDLVRLGARSAPAFEPPLIVADMTKTHQSGLDWSPKYSFEAGLLDTANWFLDDMRRKNMPDLAESA